MSVTDIEILQKGLLWAQEGHQVVLATVVQTWGSAPRKAGAHMVIREDGLFEGSVSGGCVEGAVLQEGLDIAKGARLLKFGVSTEQAWAVGLSCGGEIAIWIELLDETVIQRLVEGVNARQTVGLCLSLQAIDTMTITADWQVAPTSKTLLQEDGRAIRVYTPTRRLFVIGAVHIAQALVPMAEQIGYSVILIDPRGIFLEEKRWGNIQRFSDFPEEILPKQNLDRHDAVVALSHNPLFDDEAFWAALQAEVFYVGALGSRRNHEKRCLRLQERGCTVEQTNRISGPIGLDIGAQTPSEIAVSIIAELIQYQYAQ